MVCSLPVCTSSDKEMITSFNSIIRGHELNLIGKELNQTLNNKPLKDVNAPAVEKIENNMFPSQ